MSCETIHELEEKKQQAIKRICFEAFHIVQAQKAKSFA